MRIFVAGGTGVLGRASVRALVEAGHQVRATARSEKKAQLIQSLGAEPVNLDIFDPPAVREAIRGCEALVRLTTRIPPLTQMRDRSAWRETNLLRREGARVLVEAALATGVEVYVHESVSFVYADQGAQWITEDSPTDADKSEILHAALDGERQAERISGSGGRGVVLRFGAFYGPDAPSTAEMISGMRRRLVVQPGAGENFLSSICVPDAGRAVLAAVTVPSGTYNVVDDNPVRFHDYLRILSQATGVPKPFRFPAAFGKLMFGEVWDYFSRSLRVSSARLRQASGWKPQVPSVAEGWPRVAREMAVKRNAVAA